MALVYNTIEASDVITQVCSVEVVDSNSIFSGYIKSWNGTGFVPPTIDQLETQSTYQSFTSAAYTLSDNTVVANSFSLLPDISPGILARVSISSTDYWAFVVSNSSNALTLQMLTYDNTWLDDESLTLDSITIGGFCRYQSLSMLDKFNSSTGFGLNSRRIIQLLNGEYDNCPSQTFIGTAIYGLDRNRRPKRLKIHVKESDYPTIYYGNKSDISTVEYARQLIYGEGTVFEGFKAIFSNNTTKSVTPLSVLQFNNRISIDVYCHQSISGNVGPLVTNSGRAGTVIWKDVEKYLEFYTYGFCVDNIKAIGNVRGMLVVMVDHPMAVGNLLLSSGGYALYIIDVSANRTVFVNNLIAMPSDASFTSAIFIENANSASRVAINTAIICNCAKLADNTGTATAGKIHINKLAVQNVADLSPGIVTYDELYIIPSGEKIFLDKDNEDYRVVHPVLLRNGIGINTEMPESIIRLGDKY